MTMQPDAWVVLHTATETVSGPNVAGHAFGPFVSPEAVEAFEQRLGGDEDHCVRTLVPVFMPSEVAMPRTLAVFGALALNWLQTNAIGTPLVIGHGPFCILSGTEPGDPGDCHCGWSSFYGMYLEMQDRVVTDVGPDQQDQAHDLAHEHARRVAGA
jgi:hypothetical protein